MFSSAVSGLFYIKYAKLEVLLWIPEMFKELKNAQKWVK